MVGKVNFDLVEECADIEVELVAKLLVPCLTKPADVSIQDAKSVGILAYS